MKAKFIGKSSMGYKSDQVYILLTRIQGNYLWVQDKAKVGQPCPYASLKSFLKNWEIIEI